MSVARRRQPGFTLLELLVALLILGLIISGLAGGTKLGLKALGAQSRSLATHQDLEPVDRLLRRLVGSMALPDDKRQPGLVGDRAGFACLTHLQAAEAPGLAPRVDAVVASDNAHRLVLRWSPHLHAQRLRAGPPPSQEILLEGVARLEVSYLSPDRINWLAQWKRTDLPALIRIELIFPPGDPRRWPAIVAATRQVRARDVPDG